MDTFTIADKTFTSRLIVGTGKYSSPAVMVQAHEASGAEMVTVAVRRVNLSDRTRARGPHEPGGSSSGSGAAVASGLAMGAMGTDTGGSIRGPASWCGIAGLKPTYGYVSRRGVLPLAFSLDHAGPMCWTAEDCAIMLQAMAGHDPADPASADRPVPDYRVSLSGQVKGLRIGLIRHFYETDNPANEATRQGIANAVKVFEDLGCSVRDLRLSPLADWAACGLTIMLAEEY